MDIIMKNARFFALTLLLAFILGGCALRPGTTPAPSASVTPEVSASPPSDSPVVISPAADEPGFSLEEKTYASGNISIKYPQITGMTDTAKQDRLNKLIYRSASRDSDDIKQEAGAVDYELTYTVTLNTPELISVAFSGYSSTEGAAHPSQFLYTVTLDVKNEKVLKLRDMVTLNQAFVEVLKSAAYSSMSFDMTDENRTAIKTLLDGYDADSWLNDLQNADDTGYATCSYLTKDALAVSVSVPHVMGDHVELLVSYKALDAFRPQGSLLPRVE
jgi:hypothetical protein